MAAMLSRSLATMLQYRGEILLWAAWGIIYPLVSLAMWSAAADSSENGGWIGGFDSSRFAAYFILTMIVGHAAAAWDAFEMGWLIRSGSMSPHLVRPLLPMWSSLADNLAYKIATFGMLAPMWLLVAWITRPTFETTLPGALLGVVSLLLGSAIAYIWGYIVACLAFWTTRIDSFVELWFGGGLVFGGRLAPIDLLPPALQWVAAFLPFKWVFGFPSELLIGRITVNDASAGIAIQAAWLLGGIIVFRIVWRAAVRAYSAVGA